MLSFRPLSLPDAWRCDSCRHLMYNVDAKGYPAPGAPLPHFFSLEMPRVCQVCFFLRRTLVDHLAPPAPDPPPISN